jgi:hypothetical protein
MQYKVSPIDPIWSPSDVLLIKMWKTNPDGSPKLPMNVPILVPYCPIWGIDPLRFVEKQKFINVGLSKYVDFWKVGVAQNATYEGR